MLLIITNSQDFAVDYLINYFNQKNRACFRLNSDRLEGVSLVANIESGANQVRLQTPHQSVTLGDVSSVLYRRAFTPQIRGEYGKFRSREFKAAFEGVLLSLDDTVRWVNPLRTTEIAEHKALQLFIAKQIGFNIPETLVSNYPPDVREFLTGQATPLAKPVSHGLILESHGQRSVYAELIDKHEEINDEEVRSAPIIFQGAIVEKVDIRMTIIGSEVFTVAIDKLAHGDIDWRKSPNEVVYKVVTPPDDVVQMCHQLMAKFELLYAAIDFVIGSQGEWFFLEVNPVGEWAWLEEALGLPMRQAFEKLLYE